MSGDWVPWSAKVPQVEVETHKVGSQSRARPISATLQNKLLHSSASTIESLPCKSIPQTATPFLGPPDQFARPLLPSPSPWLVQVASPDIVVPTLDTVRHESLLYTWLAEHKPMVGREHPHSRTLIITPRLTPAQCTPRCCAVLPALAKP